MTRKSGFIRHFWPRRYGLISALCATVFAVVVGAVVWRHPHGASAPPAETTPDSAAFRPDDAQRKALGFAMVRPAPFPEEQETEGQIATADDVTVAVFPPFSGQVERVFVQAGDHVTKGQPLAAVRSSELAQARADLRAADATLTSARAQLATATANDARQAALLTERGATQRDVEQAASDLVVARGALQSGEAASSAVRDRLRILGIGESQVRALARGKAPDGALAMIRAPISGVILQRQLGPGQYLNSTANGATTTLFTISDLSKVWLTADVREQNASHISVGDTIHVQVVSLPDRTFTAKITSVGSAIDPATRRLAVHAVLSNSGGLLKPGMFATFTITSASLETSPAVPESAVVYDGADAKVWVSRADHALALRPVQVGRRHDGLVQVVKGLAPGEQVVTTGALFIDRAAKGQ